jgi:hypothetical protein
MRSPFAAAALLAGLLLPPTPGEAQEPFEGVVTMKMNPSGPDQEQMVATIWAKGARMRMEMTGRGQAMTMLADGKGAITMLVPQEKKYYVMMNAAELAKAANAGQVTLKKLGRGGSYAGYRCEWYAMGRKGMESFDVCVTRDLGSLGMDLSGRGNSGLTDADIKALRAEFGNNFFVLLQMAEGGKVLYEITKVERTKVADDRLVPPAGYTEVKLPGAPGKP